MSRATNKVATLFIQAGGSLWKLNRAEMAEMAAMGDEGVDWLIDNKRPLRTPGKKKDGTWKADVDTAFYVLDIGWLDFLSNHLHS